MKAKKPLSVVVLVINALVLVSSLVGIAGTWVVRGRLLSGLEEIVTAAETRAETAQRELDRLDTILAQAADEVAAVEREVQSLGTDLEQNSPLLTAISDRVGLQLNPLIDKAGEIVATLRETVAAVNAIVEGVNTLPFVSSPVAEPEKLDQLSQDLDRLVEEIQELRAAMEQRQSEIVQGAVALITGPTSQIGDTLEAMQASVSGYHQEIDRLLAGLSRLRSSVERGLTWGAVIVTLTLSWLAVSQVGLAVLAWRAFLGQDLLPRPRRPLDSRP